MAKVFALLLVAFVITLHSSAQSAVKKIKEKIKPKTEAKPQETPPAQTNVPSDNNASANTNVAAPPPPNPALKIYNNFDFVPGEKILFEDDFRNDQDGEFAAHWKLEGGQGVVNKMGEDRIFAVTKYYTVLSPLMKTKSYLPDEYTIEFDTWLDAGYDSNPGVGIGFKDATGEKVATIGTSHSAVDCWFPGGKLSGDMPGAIGGDAWHNAWHHVAVAVKGRQMKVYVDQYRVLVVPDDNFKGTSLVVLGDASDNTPMLFKNFKLAQGGGMNLLGKKFTDARIVTHGINFDYNKATIKPQSMGTINGIAQILKDNPGVKFEIGGHTDSDGDDKYNMGLSQQRAEAVKAQLVSMGIDASRLTTKGYGETKPINNNATPEGKADNRRVEFVKQ